MQCKPNRGLTEIEILEKHEICVSNNVADIKSLLASGDHLQVKIKEEKSRMKNLITKQLAELIYMLLPRKTRMRQDIARKYQNTAYQLKQVGE